MADSGFRRWAPGDALRPTALVHEAAIGSGSPIADR
jgi:hypothetical protein